MWEEAVHKIGIVVVGNTVGTSLHTADWDTVGVRFDCNKLTPEQLEENRLAQEVEDRVGQTFEKKKQGMEKDMEQDMERDMEQGTEQDMEPDRDRILGEWAWLLFLGEEVWFPFLVALEEDKGQDNEQNKGQNKGQDKEKLVPVDGRLHTDH